jgi:hypothetical protein
VARPGSGCRQADTTRRPKGLDESLGGVRKPLGNGPIAGDELAELVAESRRLVVASLTKAQRAAIDS